MVIVVIWDSYTGADLGDIFFEEEGHVLEMEGTAIPFDRRDGPKVMGFHSDGIETFDQSPCWEFTRYVGFPFCGLLFQMNKKKKCVYT